MISSELTCSPNHLGMLDISVDETGDKKITSSTGKKRQRSHQIKKSNC